MVSYGEDYKEMERKRMQKISGAKAVSKQSSNPIVEALMKTPGAEAIFDQLTEHKNKYVREYAGEFLEQYPFDS